MITHSTIVLRKKLQMQSNRIQYQFSFEIGCDKQIRIHLHRDKIFPLASGEKNCCERKKKAMVQMRFSIKFIYWFCDVDWGLNSTNMMQTNLQQRPNQCRFIKFLTFFLGSSQQNYYFGATFFALSDSKTSQIFMCEDDEENFSLVYPIRSCTTS